VKIAESQFWNAIILNMESSSCFIPMGNEILLLKMKSRLYNFPQTENKSSVLNRFAIIFDRQKSLLKTVSLSKGKVFNRCVLLFCHIAVETIISIFEFLAFSYNVSINSGFIISSLSTNAR